MLSNSLYATKQRIFNSLPFLANIFAFNRRSRESWIKREAAKVPAASRVLDVGAGSCPFRSLFSHCDFVTQDLTPLQPEQLQGRQGYGNIDIISAIASIPVSSESFDLIICTEVLEHVPEPILAVREFGRILRPGGVLLASAPLQSGLHQEPYHFYGGYTPYWYRKFLPEAGFSDIEIKPVGGLLRTYGAESLHVASYLTPGATYPITFRNLILIPLILLLLPWLLLSPVMFHYLDNIIFVEAFTAGYHVRATKGDNSR